MLHMNNYLLQIAIKDIGHSPFFSSRKLIAPEIGAAIIGASAQLGASGLSAAAGNANSHQGRVFSRWAVAQSQEEAKRARDWQSQESQLARLWEEEMYNMYNSPSAMKRQYMEAGINPYLAGKADLGSGMSQSAPMSSSGVQGSVVPAPPQYMPDVSGIAQAGNTIAQALGVHAQIANQQAKTDQINWETYWQIRRDVGQDTANQWAISKGLFDTPRTGASMAEEVLAGQIMSQNNDAYLKQVQASFIENYEKPKVDASIKQINKSIDEIDEQINMLKSNQQLNEEKGRELGALIKKHYAEAFKAAEDAGTVKSLRQYLVSSAAIAAGMSATQFLSGYAEFEGNEQVRQFQVSDKGKRAAKLNYVIDHNPAQRFVKGFAESLGGLMPNTVIPIK